MKNYTEFLTQISSHFLTQIYIIYIATNDPKIF